LTINGRGADTEMARTIQMRKPRSPELSGYTILLVDDDPEYLEATRILLEREGHDVLCAADGRSALDLLRRRRIDLALLDYRMPGLAEEEAVARLRELNPYSQVILQTGYGREQPPRELLRRLDIQGSYDRNEGPEKLLMRTDAGLKSARAMELLGKSRLGLRYVLDATPSLHKIQPLNELMQGVLDRAAELLGAVNSFIAAIPDEGRASSAEGRGESFVATMEDDTGLIVRAGTGRFSAMGEIPGHLELSESSLIAEALRQGRIQILDGGTVVPLRVGEAMLGVIYLDRRAILKDDVEILQVFANQAAAAIQNAQLYAMATLDSLTGAFARGFFDKWFLRELRSAFRSREPLSLLMVDVNGMKRINDTAGHLAGDQALMTVGKALRQATRATDIVGRYGGDEFAIALPQSDAEGAAIVARRILRLLEGKSPPGAGGDLFLSVSIGLSTLRTAPQDPARAPRSIPQAYFQSMGQRLIEKADEALYRAKKDKGNRLRQGEPTEWLCPDSASPPYPP
jgi:diguanylate cyclase (GGDEF)-like protein